MAPSKTSPSLLADSKACELTLTINHLNRFCTLNTWLMVKYNTERKVRSASEMKQGLRGKETDFGILNICLKYKNFFFLRIKS